MEFIDFKVKFIPSQLFLARAGKMEFFELAREAIQTICELSGGVWEAVNFSSANPETGIIRRAVRKKVEANWHLIKEICNPELQTV